MRFFRWLRWLKWPVVLAALLGLLAGVYFVHKMMKAERLAEGDEAIQATKRSGNGIVTLSPDEVKEHGIRDELAKVINWSEPVTIYGRLVPNPRTTSVLQSPFAGTLQAAPKQPWPSVGTTVKEGQLFGQVDLRVGPQERLDFQLKLNEAHLKVQGAEKVVAIQQERLGRLEKLSKDGQIISQREIDDARVLLTEAKTNLATSKAAEKLWKGALDAIDGRDDSTASIYSHRLKAPASGEVVETTARPGMSLEAGSIIARIMDFTRPLAQMDLPSDILAAGPPTRIQLTMLPASPEKPAGQRPHLMAELVGPAPQVDHTSQFTSYWYEATIKADHPKNTLPSAWRPGRFVTASVRLPSSPKTPTVAVPDTAVLVHQGRHLVYVRKAPGKFERREVQLLGREGNQAILASGVQPGEAVVVSQAQVLLSEEFRSMAGED